MRTTEDILAEYDALLQQSTVTAPRSNAANVAFMRFRTAAANLVRRTCGPESDHYRELMRLSTGEKANNPYYLSHCLGVVEAARRDVERGLLFDMRALIAAEVLGGFLEQATELLAKGHAVAAVSVAGAVLEDSLRRLCAKHDLELPPTSKIDALNSRLAAAAVYNGFIQKRITSVADLRNKADHGHFDQVKPADAKDMVEWIVRFDADYLG